MSKNQPTNSNQNPKDPNPQNPQINNPSGQPVSQNQSNRDMNQFPDSSNQSQTQQQPQANTSEDPNQVKKVQTKFQSVSLREYYDGSNMTLVLTKGLEELGRLRPANPIRFLGNFLLEHDPEK